MLYLYFYGNVISEKPDDISFMIMPYGRYWGIYVIFVGMNVLLYALIVYKDNKKDSIFYLAVISLLFIPLFKMGRWNDWGMRCSIPGLFMLMLFVIKYLNDHLEEMICNLRRGKIFNSISVIAICSFLICGSYYPILEFESSVLSEDYHVLGEEQTFGSMERYANRELDVPEDMLYNYYSYDIENNMFYKLIARNQGFW